MLGILERQRDHSGFVAVFKAAESGCRSKIVLELLDVDPWYTVMMKRHAV